MYFSKQVVIDVKIPKDSVGVVIGRQGSNIRYRSWLKLHVLSNYN